MSLIFPIVEGHGEVDAVPLLVRRVLHEELLIFDCSIITPYRLPRSKIGKFDDDLLKAVQFGGLKIAGGAGGVMIVADADDDCPAEMHGRFIEFCNQNGFNFPVSFVLANREYEAWFIACGENMRAHEWVRNDAPSHDQAETIRGAKGFFDREILIEGRTYSETVDQSKFTAQIDLSVVRGRCRSFRKLLAEVERLATT
ncbi:DUF4276 family protein [Paracoccus sp. FO-3]|uniref:DUF4276 family protein n=1 Tax=Paracoccus sp. FO-3 TaxID=1335059 RepID=UPI001126D100|nr:DUF4276 family protein [Paracoccus sp. FO-3]